MKTQYQLILIGNKNAFKDEIANTFQKRVKDLGLFDDAIIIIEAADFGNYKHNAPTVCLYFGGNSPFPDLDILDIIINDACFVLPIVDDLNTFSNKVPKNLQPINGFELKSLKEIEPLVSSIMEGLGLLRTSRRLFISYRRKESRRIAIQLYEFLDEHGFDVFLDTHSIRPGEAFQDELWHKLVDTDVVVLLNTPGFLGSKWTAEELAKASSMSIGILQLIWPGHTPISSSGFCIPNYLHDIDFEAKDYITEDALLTSATLELINGEVESLRARSLASRQDNIIQEFISASRKQSIFAHLQPERFITLNKKDGKEIALIPTVGVPHAFTYNQCEELMNRIRQLNTPEAYLLFDQRNIRKKWQEHLAWLDKHLPIKSLKITEVDNWLKTL